MFGKKTAQKLDTAAKALHDTGRKIGGEKGGRAADAAATALLGPIRARCGTGCTHGNCNHN